MGTGTSPRGADRPDRIRFGLGPMSAAARPYPGGLFALLVLLAYPAYTLARDGAAVAVGVGALVVFAALFAVSQWITPAHPLAPRLAVLAAMTVLSCWALATRGEGWWVTSVLSAVACANLLALLRFAVLGVLAQTVLAVVVGGSAVVVALVAVTGAVAVLRGRLLVEIGRARANRQAYAAAAVENERLRFARDLHDLLGHSLVTMMAKAELAERLATADPAAAAAAARDVREVGRTAMTEVHHAVTGYRSTSFAEQLDHTRAVLEPLHTTVTVSVPDPRWDAATDTMLAAVLREATTNILRHSTANHCTVTVTADAATTRLVVADNGSGGSGESGGYGIPGLRERVGELGGRLTAERRTGGGFRLTAELPATEPARHAGGPA